MFLRNFIFHDFWLKLFSLALAMVIWLTIRFNLGPGVSLTPNVMRHAEIRLGPLPITVLKGAADPRTFALQPGQAWVSVTGPAAALEDLRANNLQVFVNLADETLMDGAVKKVDVITPAGITVLRVEPSMVRVRPVVLAPIKPEPVK